MTPKSNNHTTARKLLPQLTAGSPRARFERDERPSLADLDLPGPRRAREGRDGATEPVSRLQMLIRSPLLPVLAEGFVRYTTGRKPAVPTLFWVFYLCAVRAVVSAAVLDRLLHRYWRVIQAEFFWEHNIALPDAKPDGSVPGFDDYNKWRRLHLDKYDPLPALSDLLTLSGVALARAVRRAEDGDGQRDLLTPAMWDCVAADGTVMNAPSDVRRLKSTGADGQTEQRIINSRAKDPKNARIHEEVTESIDKPHGATKGLFNVAVTTKGLDSYTRVVLAVEIGKAHEGEPPIAMRALRRVYAVTGHEFPVLLYDGAMLPTNFQELMAEFGVYTVNANTARRRDKDEPKGDPDPGLVGTFGYGQYLHGVRRGRTKRTYAMALPSIEHETGGITHQHHLVADDGAVYETDQPALSGEDLREIALVRPVGAVRLVDAAGRYYFRLTLAGACAHGGQFTVTYELRYTKHNSKGRLPWRSQIASIRVLPEALVEEYGEVNGRRNQIESFFSWMEHRYYLKDRAASWGRVAQILDLIGVASWHNTLAWAHLAYRYPQIAADLATELRELAATWRSKEPRVA